MFLRPLCCLDVRSIYYVMQVFRCIHRLSPVFLHYTFTLSPTNNERSGKNRLLVTKINTNYGKQNFYFNGAFSWNLLNTELQLCSSLKNFKLLYYVRKIFHYDDLLCYYYFLFCFNCFNICSFLCFVLPGHY